MIFVLINISCRLLFRLFKQLTHPWCCAEIIRLSDCQYKFCYTLQLLEHSITDSVYCDVTTLCEYVTCPLTVICCFITEGSKEESNRNFAKMIIQTCQTVCYQYNFAHFTDVRPKYYNQTGTWMLQSRAFPQLSIRYMNMSRDWNTVLHAQDPHQVTVRHAGVGPNNSELTYRISWEKTPGTIVSVTQSPTPLLKLFHHIRKFISILVKKKKSKYKHNTHIMSILTVGMSWVTVSSGTVTFFNTSAGT